MTLHIAKRDGGKTSEQGFSRSSTKQFHRDGIYKDGDFKVHEASTPDNTVKIDTGDIVIGSDSPDTDQPDYYYHGWSTAQESITITSNSSGSTRIDIVVAFVDLSVQDTSNSDNPGALKVKAVEGTAGSGAPSESDIQTSVGSGNPWVNLGEVTAADGFSSITNSEIADMRPKADTSWRRHNDAIADHVVSGYSVTQDSGLDGTISAGEAYIGERKVDKPEISHTFSTSVDTYVDLPQTAKPTNTDDFTYTEVSNGATAPALASGEMRIAKVVTDGSGITSVTQDSSKDDNDNRIYPNEPVDSGQIAPKSVGQSALSVGTISKTTSSTDRTAASDTFTSLTDSLELAAGTWELEYKLVVQVSTGSALWQGGEFTLSSDASSETNPDLTTWFRHDGSGSSNEGIETTLTAREVVTLSSTTTFTLMGKRTDGSDPVVKGSHVPTVIKARKLSNETS